MKKVLFISATATAILLTGCASMEAKLENTILEKSGICENEDYILYEEYRDAGKLDEEGQYISMSIAEGASSEHVESTDKIHVTFAQNGYLEIWYYTDEAMTCPIETNECYLNSGDTLYAKVIDYRNDNSNQYRLEGLRIVEFDEENRVSAEYQADAVDGEVAYVIPSNYSGMEISVMPIGMYLDRDISMETFYKDDSGREHTLGDAGTWTINEKTIAGNSAKINPLESYALTFTYDMENYFYVDCVPDCFTNDPGTSGVVAFWKAEATDADLSYRVELHPYLKLSVSFSDAAKVSVNHGKVETIKKNKAWSTDKLKYGDIITIETAGDCTIIDGNYQHINASKDPISSGSRYTLNVVQKAMNNAADELIPIVPVKRVFNVNLKTDCEYGVSSYKLDGEAVSGEIQVQEGQELVLTYKITEKKYSFAEKSEGTGGFIRDLFKPKERSITIPITTDLDGRTINPDDWFEVARKGK